MNKLRIIQHKDFIVEESRLDYQYNQSYITWHKVGVFHSLQEAEKFCENFILKKQQPIIVKEYTY